MDIIKDLEQWQWIVSNKEERWACQGVGVRKARGRRRRSVPCGGGAANVLVKHARLHYWRAFILYNLLGMCLQAQNEIGCLHIFEEV